MSFHRKTETGAVRLIYVIFLNKIECMQSANFSCCQAEGQKFAHTLAITVLFRYMDLVEFMGLFKLSAVDGLFTRC